MINCHLTQWTRVLHGYWIKCAAQMVAPAAGDCPPAPPLMGSAKLPPGTGPILQGFFILSCCYRHFGSLRCLVMSVWCLFKLYVWLLCVDLNLWTISSQLLDSTVTSANGHIGIPVSMESRPSAVDRSTQTEPTLPGQDAGQDRVLPPRRAQSLNLEDALPPEPIEETRAKLHRVPGMEEEDEEDKEAGGEQEKELSWTSSVEEPIQPTMIRGLLKEEFQHRSCSPDEPGSALTSVKTSDQNISSRNGPLSPIQEGEKTALCVISLHHNVLTIIICLVIDCMTAWLYILEKSILYLILTCGFANPSSGANLHMKQVPLPWFELCYVRAGNLWRDDVLCRHVHFSLHVLSFSCVWTGGWENIKL